MPHLKDNFWERILSLTVPIHARTTKGMNGLRWEKTITKKISKAICFFESIKLLSLFENCMTIFVIKIVSHWINNFWQGLCS